MRVIATTESAPAAAGPAAALLPPTKAPELKRRIGDLDLPTGVQTDLRDRRGLGVWAFLLALITAGALAHVAVRLHGIQIAYDVGRERRINAQLEEQRRRLHIEIGMLKDPHRVIAIARDQLHMGPPEPANVVRLGPGVILSPPSPGEQPAPAPGRPSGAPASPRSTPPKDTR